MEKVKVKLRKKVKLHDLDKEKQECPLKKELQKKQLKKTSDKK